MAKEFITVPIRILRDKNLTQSQKYILAEIEQLEMLDKGCIASNLHFSELIAISTQGVSKAIHQLEEKGYIIIDNAQTKRNNGRRLYTTGKNNIDEESAKTSKSGINHSKSGINHSKSGINHSKSGINHSKSGINHSKSGINSSLESKENRTKNRTVSKQGGQGDIKFKLSTDWKPDEKLLNDYLGMAMIKIDQIKPEWNSEFYSYWSLGKGSEIERTDSQWLKTYVDAMVKWVKSPGLFDRLNGYTPNGSGSNAKFAGAGVKPVPKVRNDVVLKQYCRAYGFTYPCPPHMNSYEEFWGLLERERTRLIDQKEREACNDGVVYEPAPVGVGL